MRTLAIGDVHGCFDAMLHVIEFAGISESDKVVWLGDYVIKLNCSYYSSDFSVKNSMCNPVSSSDMYPPD